MLNKAQDAAANRGNKTTTNLESAIFCIQIIKCFIFEYNYTSFTALVFIKKQFYQGNLSL